MPSQILVPAPAMEPLCHIIAPVGMLGYGIDAYQTDAALATLTATGAPTALILDSGSTDSGPQKLAIGGMTVARASYVRDLRKLITSARKFHVPLLFTSAGGSGTDEMTRELVKIVEELAAEIKSGPEKLNVVSVYSDVDKELVRQRLRDGAITGCGAAVPPLTESDIDEARVIASQMGPEPFVDVLLDNPDLDVLVGGRAYDPAPFIAFAEYSYKKNPTSGGDIRRRLGGFTHMGKILECGGLCAEPKGGGAIATLYVDGTFDISPLNPNSKCTAVSVAAHTLYEKSRPDHLHGPGGYLDLTKSDYEQLDDKRTVRVRGGVFVFSTDKEGDAYQIKLEGAKTVGYRTIYIGAHRDPILISQLDNLLALIRSYVRSELEGVEGTWDLKWHVYGKGQDGGVPGEVCVVGEAIASTQDLANYVASTAKIGSIHGPYKGQKATSGNFAHGLGGVSTIPLGQCAEFCIYHLMNLKEKEESIRGESPLFRVETVSIDVGGESKGSNGAAADATSSAPGSQSALPDEEDETIAAKRKKAARDAAEKLRSPPLTTLPPTPTLGDISKVIRSKNSGPYEITFDVMFEHKDVYQAVKNADILGVGVISELFHLPADQVIWSGFFDQAQAYKATIPRIRDGKCVPAGGFMEEDVHGAQMYMPLMKLELPKALSEEVQAVLTKKTSVNGNGIAH